MKNGKYYDGKSPLSVPVRLITTPDGLLITNADTDFPLAIWRREDIFQDQNHNTAIVLGNKNNKARIELTDSEIAMALGFNYDSIIQSHFSLIFKWFGALTFVVVIFWLSIPFVTKTIAKKIPYDIEQKIASQMPIEKSFDMCQLSAKEEKALKIYTQYIYPQTDVEKLMPVHFSVAKNPAVNALTFPGGRIVLYTGFIRDAKSPEEFLGVMAHEIGHVVGRDSVSFLVRGTLLASLFGYLTGDFNSTFAVSPQILLSTAALTFDRDMERKADLYAASRLMKNNIGTSGLKSFFSRKNHEEGLIMPEMFMTHPDFESRTQAIPEFYPKKDLPKDITDNWEVIRKICQ